MDAVVECSIWALWTYCFKQSTREGRGPSLPRPPHHTPILLPLCLSFSGSLCLYWSLSVSLYVYLSLEAHVINYLWHVLRQNRTPVDIWQNAEFPAYTVIWQKERATETQRERATEKQREGEILICEQMDWCSFLERTVSAKPLLFLCFWQCVCVCAWHGMGWFFNFLVPFSLSVCFCLVLSSPFSLVKTPQLA